MSSKLFFTVSGLFLTAFVVLFGARTLLAGGTGTTIASPSPTPTGFAIIVPPMSSLLSGQLLTEPESSTPPVSLPTTVTAAPSVTPSAARRNVLIEANWPPTLSTGDSDGVAIWLIQTTDRFYVGEIERGGQTAVPATLVPRGTPEAPYPLAFGPDYKLVSATALLTATNIDIVATGDTTIPFPLDENRVGWLWNISPRSTGKQVMTAIVRFRWESPDGEPKELAVWQYTLDILVTPPPSKQQLSLDTPASPEVQSGMDQVGFWADALQVVTGLGALFAFAGGVVKWGLTRAKSLVGG